MAEFTKRLRWCLKHGNMTVADLKHWFDRPYATVRMWVFDARTPRGPSGKSADLLLRQLEARIRKGLTIPSTLSSHERPAYVRKLRHGHSAGVPAPHTAG